MRQLRATVTVGSRYGRSSRGRMGFWPRFRLLTNSAITRPMNISKITARIVNLTVLRMDCWKYGSLSSFV